MNHEIDVLALSKNFRKVKKLTLKSLKNIIGVPEIDNNTWGFQIITLNIWDPQNIRLKI